MATHGRSGVRGRFIGAVAFASCMLLAGCAEAPDTAAEADEAGGAAGTSMASADSPHFGFGQPLSDAEIAAWNIDVGPTGEGLPPGSGDATTGAAVYQARCVACHGATGVEGPNNVLVSEPGDPFTDGFTTGVRSTIGNYWPYATTVFDYVRRSMPFESPGSLTDDEVYAVTAWMLWRNGLIEEGEVMDAETLPEVEMPGRDHFVPSDDVDLRSLP